MTPSPGGIAAFSLRHRRALTVATLGLCAAGMAALFTLGTGIYPDVAFPRIVVIAERGEESVENMMIGVTRPMEESVGAVPGLIRVRSKTIRGASELALDFSPDADMREALSQTRARVAGLAPSLPPGVETTIEQQTPSVFPVISFTVSLDPTKARPPLRDEADLMQWARVELKPPLARIPDVFLVSLQGSQSRVVVVEPDPRRLAAAALTIEDVTRAVKDANQIEAVGVLDRDYRRWQVIASNEMRTLDQISAVTVTTRGGVPIHVGDVARVYPGLTDPSMVITGNGLNSLVVSLFMRYGGKITDLSDRVNATLAELSPTLPPGVRFTPVYDQSQLVRESLGGVRDAIGIGVLLAVFVLWAFLRSWRLTWIAAASIPISVLVTFAALHALGGSLNLMSLGGIAVAIGLIIDDAIVVVENISRGLRADRDRGESVIVSTGQVFGAVVGSSLTTVVVFVPLVLLEGVVGQFFKAMAVALAVGIMVSMLVSLTLTPMMAAGRLGPRAGEEAGRPWMERLAEAYERFIARVLRRPGRAALLLAAFALAGGILIPMQETGFLPQMDEGGFVMDYVMPVGTSLAETDKNCRKVEALFLATPEIASFSRRTGGELGFFATELNTGDFLVGLKPRGERRRDGFEVIAELRERIAREAPQMEVRFQQLMQDTINDLAGNPSPIEVKIFGSDYRDLQSEAKRVVAKLERIPGVVDAQGGVSYGSPEITYRLDPEAIARMGLTAEGVESQLRTALLGEEATILRRSERLVPVLVRYPDALRHDPTWLSQMPLAKPDGKSIPASAVSRIEERTGFNSLTRENQQPMVAVTANISGRDLGSVARDVRTLLANESWPKGVRAQLAGQVESKERAFRNLMLVLSLATGMVFLLLVIQFRSYRLPLVIFLALPFSQIGGLLALRLTDTELNISAFMGLIMLVGLVVKNGIILIEYTSQLREEGVPTLDEALVRAGRVRLRPILMTSLTAVMALLPLALNLGAGAELQRPLAIAIVGGLCVSTFFTLVVIPVAYVLMGEPEHLKPRSPEAVPA